MRTTGEVNRELVAAALGVAAAALALVAAIVLAAAAVDTATRIAEHMPDRVATYEWIVLSAIVAGLALEALRVFYFKGEE